MCSHLLLERPGRRPRAATPAVLRIHRAAGATYRPERQGDPAPGLSAKNRRQKPPPKTTEWKPRPDRTARSLQQPGVIVSVNWNKVNGRRRGNRCNGIWNTGGTGRKTPPDQDKKRSGGVKHQIRKNPPLFPLSRRERGGKKTTTGSARCCEIQSWTHQPG